MPVTIKTNAMKYKNTTTGEYEGFNAVQVASTADQIAEIESAGEDQITAVEAKGAEVLESIPEDYSALTAEVADIKSVNKIFNRDVVGVPNPIDTATWIDNANLNDSGATKAAQGWKVTEGYIETSADSYKISYNNSETLYIVQVAGYTSSGSFVRMFANADSSSGVRSFTIDTTSVDKIRIATRYGNPILSVYPNDGKIVEKLASVEDDVSDLKSAVESVEDDVGILTTTVSGKQDALTFDNTPTANSNNPVKSGGIYNAVNNEKVRAEAEEERLESLFTAPTQEAVDNWLDEHPEATTTVQDHSLTYEKLVNGTLGFVTPEMFGAVGDGVTDDTEAFNELFKHPVICLTHNKTYKIDYAKIQNENTYIFGNGATISINSVKSGAITIEDSDTAGQISNRGRWFNSQLANVFYAENIHFEGNGASFVGYSNFDVVWGLYDIILLYNYKHVRICNCTFNDTVQDAINIRGGSVIISGCKFTNIASSSATKTINGTRNAISVNALNAVYGHPDQNSVDPGSFVAIENNAFENVYNEIVRLDNYAVTSITNNTVLNGKQYFVESFWDYASYPCIVNITGNYIDKLGDTMMNVSTLTPYGLRINISKNNITNLHYDFGGDQPSAIYGAALVECTYNNTNPVVVDITNNEIICNNTPLEIKVFINCTNNELRMINNIIHVASTRAIAYFKKGIIRGNKISVGSNSYPYTFSVGTEGVEFTDNNFIFTNKITGFIQTGITTESYSFVKFIDNVIDAMPKYSPLFGCEDDTIIENMIVRGNIIKGGTYLAIKGTVTNYILDNNITPTPFFMHQDVTNTNNVVANNITYYT